jgi:hypothetical protein
MDPARVTADEPPQWLVAVLVQCISFGRHFRRSFARARCRRRGHTEAVARFAWPPEPGRYAARAQCRRCGEVYGIDAPLAAIRRPQ